MSKTQSGQQLSVKNLCFINPLDPIVLFPFESFNNEVHFSFC